MYAARDPKAEYGRGCFAFAVVSLCLYPRNSHEAYALDQERASCMPHFISVSLIGFLIVALAARRFRRTAFEARASAFVGRFALRTAGYRLRWSTTTEVYS
jgi:hypothetical protein